MRQTTTKATPDPLTAYLEAARDQALATVRALLVDDGPAQPGYPRETQIENHLKTAEAAARRLDLFASGAAL